jgi:ABC-type multidrug transport system fused ATPase/permease subunit
MHGGPMRKMMEQSSDEKAKNPNLVVGKLVNLVLPHKGKVIGSLILVLLTAASQGASPYLIGVAVDQFISKGDSIGLGGIILALVVVFLLGMVATRFQIILINQVGQSILADLRQKVFVKVESLSLQYLESKQAGELMSRLVNDIDALNNFFSQGLAQMIGQFFALLGIGIAMLLLSWQLGLAVLVMIPVLLLVTKVFSRWARTAFRKTRTTIGDISAELEEEISGVKVAQAFNRTDVNVRKFATRNAANRDANISATAVTSGFAPTMDVLSTVDLALVAGIGGAMVIAGTATVGVVVAFLQYVQNFFRPIQQVAQLWTSAQSAFAAAERVFELLEVAPAVRDEPDASVMKTINGRVQFKDVSFQYEEDQPVLDKVNFTAEPGEMVAIVGPTGAGKTTMVSLLARFYDVTGGSVLVDGMDVRKVTQKSLRSQMGIVTQEPFLFSGTIMENIRYGRLDATDEEVISSAEAANADDFIKRLPKGYQSEVGERGKLISQGQRQLISIARAVLADPRILILDEATASIDTRTELLIQNALQRLLKGRTSFVIAHRLSTVRSADQVLVIADSKIKERGTHQELLHQNGIYTDLYQRQYYQHDTGELKEVQV